MRQSDPSSRTSTVDPVRCEALTKLYGPGAAISHGIQWREALALTAASALLLGLARLAVERRDLA